MAVHKNHKRLIGVIYIFFTETTITVLPLKKCRAEIVDEMSSLNLTSVKFGASIRKKKLENELQALNEEIDSIEKNYGKQIPL